MARLHESSDNEEELPELSTLLNAARSKPSDVQTNRAIPGNAQRTSPIHRTNSTDDKSTSIMTAPLPLSENVLESFSNDTQVRIQKPLRLVHVNSLILPTLPSKVMPTKSPRKLQATFSIIEIEKRRSGRTARDTPKRVAAQKVDFKAFVEDFGEALQQQQEEEEEEEEDENLSDFIVSDGSEVELRRPRGASKKLQSRRFDGSGLDKNGLNNNLEPKSAVPDLALPEKPTPATKTHKPRRPLTSEGHPQRNLIEDWGSTLKYSPPRSRSPRKKTHSPRKPLFTNHSITPPALATPPTSPSKPRLQSPSKSTHARIPPSPHRPSLDAFWNASEINDWNETYSPSKSSIRRELFPVTEDDESVTAAGSPRKSPAKKDKTAIEQKKAFDASKHAVAEAFLKELDDTLAEGQVAALTTSTGGLKLVWSTKLTSTAGRAKWRRETLRPCSVSSPSATPTPTPSYRQHALIELSHKIITSPPRLLNTLAHEYCHLANIMISGVHDQPHGASFKAWGRKVSAAFGDRGVEVTTRHDYQIAHKYIWACGMCGTEYKRHSKSIDVTRHACGGCKGALVQVTPAPRGGGGGDGGGEGGKAGAFQAFVKERYARVKREEPGWGMGEIMVRLGREYREEREMAKAKGVAEDVKGRGGDGKEGIEGEVMEVGSEGDGKEAEGNGGGEALMAGHVHEELDEVARKLGELHLDGEGQRE